MSLNKAIENKIETFKSNAEQMPGVVIIHRIGNFEVEYMSANGLHQLGVTMNELKSMGAGYHQQFFNSEEADTENFLLQMEKLLRNNNPDESFSFFQQVRLKDRIGWTWHISAIRIFMWDDDGKPVLTLTTAIPIDRMKHVEAKAQRLLDENNFLRKNSKAFARLSKREQVILQMVAKGKSSPDIADELFIAADTVQTHRRNIKKKLGISTGFEFTEYALAFNLV